MKLDIGFDGPVQIRKVALPELVSSGISILYLSDFHFNRYSRHLANRLIKLVDAVQPDILLLGGDYADTRAGLMHFESFLAVTRGLATYAVAGNHDYFFGLARVRESLEKRGVRWLEKEGAVLHLNDRTVAIDGNCFQHTPADYRILCLHKPVRVPLTATYHL
ncbi:MAG: metallophosphoesterase, partial [Saprospiraceae bacterium]|nr:metallophosphoesterase [Saprospiraceae bacterium]